MTGHRRSLLTAALGLALLAAPAAAAQYGEPGTRDVRRLAGEPVDVDGDCNDELPGDLDLPRGASVRISVLLTYDDGITPARARQLGAGITRIYAPAGVNAKVVTRRLPVEGRDARAVIARARSALGGGVPTGFDVVHVLTPVDLTSQGDDSSIGLADCIGGIRDRRRAFSVSEMSPMVRGITLGPVTGSGDEEARSAAHEIGHLLGARHEHANCAEGAPATRTTDSTCTIMFLAAPSSDVLGQLEAGVIRDYARKYAG